MHLCWQWNCWSLRCSWSIACQCCSNYIFILDLTPGFNVLGEDNHKTRWESFKFWELVQLILDILRYIRLLSNLLVSFIFNMMSTSTLHTSHNFHKNGDFFIYWVLLFLTQKAWQPTIDFIPKSCWLEIKRSFKMLRFNLKAGTFPCEFFNSTEGLHILV